MREYEVRIRFQGSISTVRVNASDIRLRPHTRLLCGGAGISCPLAVPFLIRFVVRGRCWRQGWITVQVG